MERVDSDPLNLVFQLSGMMSVYTSPKETDAIAHIHNHPSGYVLPSFEDINTFLHLLRYSSIKYALIAATSNSVVSGFYCLEYHGDKTATMKLIQANRKFNERIIRERHRAIEAYPKEFTHLRIGDSIFSFDEQITMVLERMEKNHITHYPLPLPGYKFQDRRFVKE